MHTIKINTMSQTSSNSQFKSGYLELFIGPMYSGKTSKILEIYEQCKFCNISIAVLNHSDDTRYHESMLSTHDQRMIPCIQTKNIMDVWDYKKIDELYNEKSAQHLQLRNAEVILINEGQFFDDLFVCVESMIKENKRVYIAGLDGDFERKKFGQILDLIPLSNMVTKLTSLCSICKDGTPGIFSKRITNEKQQMLIGSANYVPVCRNCYDN